MREDNSSAAKPLPRAAHGLRHLQPPLRRLVKEPAGPGKRRGARPANSAGPGGREGYQRASKPRVGLFCPSRWPPPGPRLPPRPGSNTRRPTALPVTTRTPRRRRASPAARGPHPSDSTRPFPGSNPGPAARPVAGRGPAPLPTSPALRGGPAPPRSLRAPRRGTHRPPPGQVSPGRGDSERHGHRRLLFLCTSPGGEQGVAVRAPPGPKRSSPPPQPPPPSPFTRPSRPEKMSPEAVPLGASLPPGTTEPEPVG